MMVMRIVWRAGALLAAIGLAAILASIALSVAGLSNIVSEASTWIVLASSVSILAGGTLMLVAGDSDGAPLAAIGAVGVLIALASI